MSFDLGSLFSINNKSIKKSEEAKTIERSADLNNVYLPKSRTRKAELLKPERENFLNYSYSIAKSIYLSQMQPSDPELEMEVRGKRPKPNSSPVYTIEADEIRKQI